MTTDFVAAKQKAREERAYTRKLEKCTVQMQALVRGKLARIRLKRFLEQTLLHETKADPLHQALIDYLRIIHLDGFLRVKLKTLKRTSQQVIDFWTSICKKLQKMPFENLDHAARLGVTLVRLTYCCPDHAYFTSRANQNNLTLWIMTIFRCFTPKLWKAKFKIVSTDIGGQASNDLCLSFFRLLTPMYYGKNPTISAPIQLAILKLAVRCQPHNLIQLFRIPTFLTQQKVLDTILNAQDDCYQRAVILASIYVKRCTSEDLLFMFANILTVLNRKPELLVHTQIIKTLYLITNKMHRKKVSSFKPGQSYIHPILGSQNDKVMHQSEVFEAVGVQLRSIGSSVFLSSILSRVIILAEEMPDLSEEVYTERSSGFSFNSWKEFLQEIKAKTAKPTVKEKLERDTGIISLSTPQITPQDIDSAFYICSVYSSIAYIITNESISQDILVAFSCVPNILSRLWKFIGSIGAQTFTRAFDLKDLILSTAKPAPVQTSLLRQLSQKVQSSDKRESVSQEDQDPPFPINDEKVFNAQRLAGILTLFTQCANLYVSVATADTLYSNAVPKIADQALSAVNVARCAVFFNTLIFNLLYNVLFDESGNTVDDIHGVLHRVNGTLLGDITLDASIKAWRELLLAIYDHDRKRPFIALTKTKTQNSLFEELEARWQQPAQSNTLPARLPQTYKNGSKRFSPVLQGYLPWIYSFKVRVAVFREQIDQERRHFVQQAHHIEIRRESIVEDAFESFRRIQGKTLKAPIRVKFVNELGLAEAGIDQMGVFKEFLAVLAEKLFSADFGLFRWTDGGEHGESGTSDGPERCLYPSSMSGLCHGNHLDLFNFAGKVLGKALYEGIVVDVPLATFFRRTLLPKKAVNDCYSVLDDLPLLDPVLYRNLEQVRAIDDVEPLCLTFCFEEDEMGQLKQYELCTGGRHIDVTNHNRIKYIHQLVNYKFNIHISKQIKAFVAGFLEVIPQMLLVNFASPSELGRLMAGDCFSTDVNVDDLKKNVQYYGGFHGRHKVIIWLFEVLESTFNAKERRAFLKFVTSCSSPPLLGFANLQPPFSIRCVECDEDNDQGDNLGSVMRGFLGIRSSKMVARLPTASTCFNLLKLPNYSSKKVLREKLRQAILHNTGFELS